MKSIDVTPITANIPWADVDSAYFVYTLQKSDKDSLPINDNATKVETEHGCSILKICHSKEAFEQNIRGYISTLLPALQCRMDIQSSDGHGLLLKYVSSYVAKGHDAYHSKCLYSPNTTPYEAAYRHLRDMKPLEPEMWLLLSLKKIAWNPHRLKKFTVPTPTTATNNKVLQKYWSRPHHLNRLSLLQWLRALDTSKCKPVEYKTGHTLVGTKLVSVFNDYYFFQDLSLNVPHRNIDMSLIPASENLPPVVRYFASAIHYRSELWSNENAIRRHFDMEGHKSWYITNIVLHIESLTDFYNLLNKRVHNV